MAGSDRNENQPPRRRRRAARRAAGPPTPVTAPPVPNAPTAAAPTARTPASATPIAETAAARSPVGTGEHAAATAQSDPGLPPAAAHPAGAAVSHGSPGDAPGHQPGPGHGPAVHGAGGADPTRERSANRASGSSAGGGESHRSGRTAREDAAERSLRSLVTTRSTQVSPSAALRAREVALPSADDLAAAEAEVIIVRRHYVPPTVLATGRRPDRSNRRGSAE